SRSVVKVAAARRTQDYLLERRDCGLSGGAFDRATFFQLPRPWCFEVAPARQQLRARKHLALGQGTRPWMPSESPRFVRCRRRLSPSLPAIPAPMPTLWRPTLSPVSSHPYSPCSNVVAEERDEEYSRPTQLPRGSRTQSTL